MAQFITAFAAATLALLSPMLVQAGDQTVLGRSFVVKDPAPGVDAAQRNITILGKELLSPNTVVGDPQINGATVEIIANGTTPTVQTFTLPPGVGVAGAPGWKALGNPVLGYSYKDAAGVNGPVKTALLKRTGNGTFVVKVVLKGSLGPGPQPHIEVVPPANGTDGGMRFTVNGGDTYCVSFGGAAGGAVTNSPTGVGTKVFKVASTKTSLTVETGCPTSAVTTTTVTTSSTTSTSTSTSTSTTTSSSTTSSTTTSTSSTTTSSSSTTTTATTTSSSSTSIVETTTTTGESTTSNESTTTTSTTVPGGVNLNSPVIATSACLTNATGAQAAIVLTLTDNASAPLTGAVVSIMTTAGTLGPVQSSGNVYWAILTAPASGTSAQVTVIANGQTLNTSPLIALSVPFTETTGGTGGCAQDGNLRVRVVDETGAPLAGASVLLGQDEQLNAYVTTYGAPADGATTASTDAQGYAVFRDFGTTLSGPVTVTAGAANREYVTIAGADASDVVLPLAPVVRSVASGTLTGDVNGISSSSNVEVGVVLGNVTLNTLASFNLNSLLADNVCYNGGLVGSFNVPDNVFIPAQTVVIVGIPKKSYRSAPLPFGVRHVVALGGNTPSSALTGGGGVAAALSQLTFTNITAQTINVTTPGPSAATFTESTYGSTTACTATGAPGIDGFCIAALDWDGNTTVSRNVGEGALGVFSFKTTPSSGGAVNITGVNYKAKTAGAPNPFTAVGHMGAVVSLNLDKSAVTIPPGTANGVSVILKRNFSSDTFPATFAYGSMFPIRIHSQSARTLALDSPAGLAGAQYVKHTLAQEISTQYSGCAANDSTRTTTNTLWEVYGPVSAGSVTLPTLPASFPRAALGGNLPGLLDPTTTVESDKVTWTSTTIEEGLNPSFDYNQLHLNSFQRYGTHFTTNSSDYTP